MTSPSNCRRHRLHIIFGTDTIGQDILARTIYGGQISLLIGVSAALIGVIVGTLVGAIAAYYGGWADSVLMRFTEAMLNIPSLFLLIVAAKFLGGTIPEITLLGRTFSSSVVVIIVIIGLTSWMYLARIVRANILSLKEQDFISASRCLGVSNGRMIRQAPAAEYPGTGNCYRNPRHCQRHSQRGICEFFGAGCKAAHCQLGQYAGELLPVFGERAVAVGVSGLVCLDYCVER